MSVRTGSTDPRLVGRWGGGMKRGAAEARGLALTAPTLGLLLWRRGGGGGLGWMGGWVGGSTPCVTFRRVAVSVRGPGQSPVLPFACCVGSLHFVGRCDLCSCGCRFRVGGARSLVRWCRLWVYPPPPLSSGAEVLEAPKAPKKIFSSKLIGAKGAREKF